MSEFYGDFDEQFSEENNSVSTQITQRTYSLKLCNDNGNNGSNGSNGSNNIISGMKYTGSNNINIEITKNNSKNSIMKNK